MPRWTSAITASMDGSASGPSTSSGRSCSTGYRGRCRSARTTPPISRTCCSQCCVTCTTPLWMIRPATPSPTSRPRSPPPPVTRSGRRCPTNATSASRNSGPCGQSPPVSTRPTRSRCGASPTAPAPAGSNTMMRFSTTSSHGICVVTAGRPRAPAPSCRCHSRRSTSLPRWRRTTGSSGSCVRSPTGSAPAAR